MVMPSHPSAKQRFFKISNAEKMPGESPSGRWKRGTFVLSLHLSPISPTSGYANVPQYKSFSSLPRFLSSQRLFRPCTVLFPDPLPEQFRHRQRRWWLFQNSLLPILFFIWIALPLSSAQPRCAAEDLQSCTFVIPCVIHRSATDPCLITGSPRPRPFLFDLFDLGCRRIESGSRILYIIDSAPLRLVSDSCVFRHRSEQGCRIRDKAFGISSKSLCSIPHRKTTQEVESRALQGQDDAMGFDPLIEAVDARRPLLSFYPDSSPFKNERSVGTYTHNTANSRRTFRCPPARLHIFSSLLPRPRTGICSHRRVPRNGGRRSIGNESTIRKFPSRIHRFSDTCIITAEVPFQFLQATAQARQPEHRLWSKKKPYCGITLPPYFSISTALCMRKNQQSSLANPDY